MESLVAGACAGLFVDLSLYPIDTVKTRLQSKEGFLASGGFKNVYKGLSAMAVGSVPGGAAFFFGYDTAKRSLLSLAGCSSAANGTEASSVAITPTVMACQAAAAMCGECFACCIRVPVEMLKQQMQAGHHATIASALRNVTNNTATLGASAGDAAAAAPLLPIRLSGVRHLFRGMPIMLMRELPFSVIQMSLYEFLKAKMLTPTEHSHASISLPFCGAFSGGCAAFITTPLDVLKTRIMLFRHGQGQEKVSIRYVLDELIREPARPGDRFGYVQRFFRGASTRVLWISLGGSIFFGTYEFVKSGFQNVPPV
ncbi:mitochondrial carrier protein, putative [Leishmania tarentolae]|uniref:Mitochondrial carrier protein, putative n=1 Tax=Leishmania tarentolae TaxID=5689 RepID=A0A640KV07_LEITA|nr:mitochondrial carrier protein, putative [Leishmania tarentolae]